MDDTSIYKICFFIILNLMNFFKHRLKVLIPVLDIIILLTLAERYSEHCIRAVSFNEIKANLANHLVCQLSRPCLIDSWLASYIIKMSS